MKLGHNLCDISEITQSNLWPNTTVLRKEKIIRVRHFLNKNKDALIIKKQAEAMWALPGFSQLYFDYSGSPHGHQGEACLVSVMQIPVRRKPEVVTDMENQGLGLLSLISCAMTNKAGYYYQPLPPYNSFQGSREGSWVFKLSTTS